MSDNVLHQTVILQCQCGAIRGYADLQHSYGRAVCYCADCQAYARFLGCEGEILDVHGGTDILAMLPAGVHFTTGIDKLACMSLSDKGLLRWYASCCRTPIGNTPRDQKTAYVGLVAMSLPSLDKSVEPPRMVLNIGSARGTVRAAPFATFLGIVRIMWNVIGARLGKRYKTNPFFTSDSNIPIRPPKILASAERKALADVA